MYSEVRGAANLSGVPCPVTAVAQDNEVIRDIGSTLRPELLMVNLQVFHRAAALAAPAIAL